MNIKLLTRQLAEYQDISQTQAASIIKFIFDKLCDESCHNLQRKLKQYRYKKNSS